MSRANEKTRHLNLAGRTRLHRYGLERFLIDVSAKLEPGTLLLDGGAGNCKHKNFFPHLNVVALDLGVKKRRRYGDIDIAGDLYAIPCRDNCFDAVINVEVLEHLEEPEAVLREIFRVLKRGGRLYLVAPQGWEEHCIPHDYYRFTRIRRMPRPVDGDECVGGAGIRNRGGEAMNRA